MWQGTLVGQSGKATWRRSPRSRVERPVPPPIATTRRGAEEPDAPDAWVSDAEVSGCGGTDFKDGLDDEPGVTKVPAS